MRSVATAWRCVLASCSDQRSYNQYTCGVESLRPSARSSAHHLRRSRASAVRRRCGRRSARAVPARPSARSALERRSRACRLQRVAASLRPSLIDSLHPPLERGSCPLRLELRPVRLRGRSVALPALRAVWRHASRRPEQRQHAHPSWHRRVLAPSVRELEAASRQTSCSTSSAADSLDPFSAT